MKNIKFDIKPISVAILIKVFLATSSIFANAEIIDLKSGFGRDHAALEDKQSEIMVALEHELFYSAKGSISLQKIEATLKRLKDERERLLKDLIETDIIERVELDVVSQQKAIKKAEEMSNSTKKILSLYDRYLIPTVQTLKGLVQENRDAHLWEGLIQDFFRVYHVFFAPNAKITRWARNNDLVSVVWHSLFPRKFKKNDPKKDEAINLIVEQENLESVRTCLSKKVDIGHYLTRTELVGLRNCGFDLSLLNPGVSAFWEKRTQDEIKHLRSGRKDLIPDGLKFEFNEVMLTGAGSPKIEVEAKVNGKKRKFKIKWGNEAHTDTAASVIAYHLGFNQDYSEYRSNIRVELGKYTYDEFMSMLLFKYGPSDTIRSVLTHGGDPGKEWIEIKDALLEPRGEGELRILPFDPTVSDFKLRREYNAHLLVLAFLNAQDTKPANMKILLEEPPKSHSMELENSGVKESGELGAETQPPHLLSAEQQSSVQRPRVRLRFQDMGFTLGTSTFVTNPEKLLYFSQKYFPNEFEADGIVKANRSKTEVKIRWNDFYDLNGKFETATYADLKWMARKIAGMSGDDFEWCLLFSGMPKEVAKLYRYKLLSRRNEMIHAFALEAEFQKELAEEIPDLKKWNSTPENPEDSPAVVRGKVVKTHFPGKQQYLINQNTFSYFLIGLLNSQWSQISNYSTYLKEFGLGRNGTGSIQGGANGLVGVGAGLGATPTAASQPNPLQISIPAGINVSLGRSVGISPHLFNSESDQKARPYLVKDTLVFSIGFSSPLLKKVSSWLPASVQASLRVFQLQYEYYHFAETLLEGYTKSFMPFLKAISDPVRQAEHLGRMEVIHKFHSLGFEAGVNANVFGFDAVVTSKLGVSAVEVGVNGGYVRMDDYSIFRDRYGQIHLFTQKTNQGSLGLDLSIGKLANPIWNRAALVSYKNSFFSFHTVQKDWVAERTDGQVSTDAPLPPTDAMLLDELQALKKAYSSDKEIQDLEKFSSNFQVESDGTFSVNEKILLFHGKRKDKAYTHTKIDFHNGHEKILSRHATEREQFVGIPARYFAIGQNDLAVNHAKRVGITIEMDDNNPDAFTIVLRNIDFFRVEKHVEIEKLIADLNLRFSKNKQTPFYQNYELPSEKVIDEYRKVYGLTRVYISGYELLERLENIKEEDLEKLSVAFFQTSKEKRSGKKLSELSSFQRKLTERRIQSLKTDLMEHYKKLYKEIHRPKRNYKAIFPLLDKFIYHQKIQKYGIGLLQALLGENHLFVMGEISGIFPSFSAANDLQENQRRRFAGNHWGNFSAVPPVQAHIKYDQLMYQSVLAPQHISTTEMFGPRTSGYSEDIK